MSIDVAPPVAPSLAVRSKGTARMLAVGVIVALSLVLGQGGAQAAVLYVPPVPIPIPPAVAGTAVDTGAAAAGGLTVDGAGLAFAGYGAYQGTCWVAGQLQKLWGGTNSCASGQNQIMNWLTGSNGDDRSTLTASAPWRFVTRTGTCTAGNVGVGCPVYPSPDGHTGVSWSVTNIGTLNGTFRYGYTCANGTTVEIGYDADWTSSAITTAAVDSDIKTNCGGAGSYAVEAGAAYWSTLKTLWFDSGKCGGATCAAGAAESTVTWTRYASWNYDPPQAWSLTWTETCIAADGSSTTSSVTQTMTALQMTGSSTQTAPTLPNCWDILPGGHRSDIKVVGGRTSASTPEVNIDYPTYGTGATTSYPLCTTKSPVGGCWLDLKKNGQSCFDGQTYCAGWMSNETGWNMTCNWGPYTMALSVCENAYGTSFDLMPQPTPTPTGGPAGAPLPTTGTNPQPSSQPTPTTGAAPNPPPVTSTTNPESENCWGSGWSWNPVSWVYVPVKCALDWAFVPQTPPSFGDIPSPLPAGWIPSFPSLSDGSCGPVTMPSISLGRLGGNSGAVTLFNSCNAPWPLARNLTYYGILAVGLVGLGYRGFEMVMKALGMDVSVGGGGDDE